MGRLRVNCNCLRFAAAADPIGSLVDWLICLIGLLVGGFIGSLVHLLIR